jgi:pimeloyl-ACP methyl ester carboxylesterase
MVVLGWFGGRATLTIMLVLISSLGAGLGAAQINDPATVVEERFQASGRVRDILANPAHLELMANACKENRGAECDGDPFRRIEDWDRGSHERVNITNRYEVALAADLFGPADDGPGPKKHPTVVFVSGFGSPRFSYRWAAQGLAEAGYIVLLFDPQNHGESLSPADPATFGLTPEPTWASKYCQADGWYREPQEYGFRETRTCAGDMPSLPEALVGQAPAITGDTSGLQALYHDVAPNQVFGALDATAWLLDPAKNPWHDRIRTDRMAIVGHSLGAYAAALIGNSDPRFIAAASLDSFGYLDLGVAPTVPTMFQQSAQENLNGPWLVPPREGYHPTRATYDAFTGACVPSTFLVLGQSTHNEWQYLAPIGPTGEASSKGERVGLYFLLAWLDLYVRNTADNESFHNGGADARDAFGRLTADTFDNSADASAIGSGAWDPVLGNVPHTIEGESVVEHLSPFFSSGMALGC